MLRVERLRYLRQLVQAAPDVLWALIRAEPLFLSEARDSLAWLFRRLSATIPLGDPDEHWPAWADLMCRSPGRFRGWVKRAAAQEVLRLTAHAAFHACRSFLAPYCANDAGARARDGPTCFVEACLPCRKAFVDRVSWACHASKVHGYRTRATELTKGLPQAWCSGCGKMFANAARMKRHAFATPSCQLAWGSFLPAEGASLAPLHPSAPPAQLPGRFAASHAEDRPGDVECHPGLLDALLSLDAADDSSAWEVVVDFVAPIDHLRHTVRTWRSHERAQGFAPETADNLLLLLDPDLCCDHFPAQAPLSL